MAGFSLTGARKDDGGWGTRERPFPSVTKQRLCSALRSLPRRSGARRRSAPAVSGSLCAPVRESSGAPRCSRQSLGAAGRALARQTPARGGAAPAPEPVSSPPCAPANPAPSAGEERKAPDLQGQRWRATPGPARARRRGVGTKAPRQRLPYNGLALQAARLSPATRHPRASALTSGQRGTVVHRDPDLLHPALSQFQGHLHSLDLATLCPLRTIQT